MLGVVAGIVGGAVAFAVLHTYFEGGFGDSNRSNQQGPIRELPEPDRNAPRPPPDGKFQAPLWQKSAKEALNRFKRLRK